MNARYARVSRISPPISDMKNPHQIRSRYLIFRTLPIMKPCRIRNVSDTRVRHICHVYFNEFITYPCVVSISLLLCPCNIAEQMAKGNYARVCVQIDCSKPALA